MAGKYSIFEEKVEIPRALLTNYLNVNTLMFARGKQMILRGLFVT